VLEDEGVLKANDRLHHYTAETVTDWISRTTQTLEATADLVRKLRTKLQIVCLEPPPTRLAKRKASLDQLLEAVIGEQEDVETVKSLLHDWANRRTGKRNKPKQ
jgi:hypothetical protein